MAQWLTWQHPWIILTFTSEEDISYPGRNQRTLHITGKWAYIMTDTSWEFAATGQHPVCCMTCVCTLACVYVGLSACAEMQNGAYITCVFEWEWKRERQSEGDDCSSRKEVRWIPSAGIYLFSAAGINRHCPLLQQIYYNPFCPFCFSRKNPLGLIVALSDAGTAKGSFLWDDGEGIGKQKVTFEHVQPPKQQILYVFMESLFLNSKMTH